MGRTMHVLSVRSLCDRGALAAVLLAAVALAGGFVPHMPARAASSPGPLALSLVAGASAQVGSLATLTFTATNTTAEAIGGVDIILAGTSDTVTLAQVNQSIKVIQPAGLACILRHFECLLSTPLAAGDSIILTIAFTPTTLDTLDTVVASGYPGSDGVVIVNSVDQVTTVSPGPTDVQVTGSASTGSPNRGATYSYTFQVKNNGPLPAYNVTFGDPLPPADSFAGVQASAGSCTQAAGTVSCALGDLAVGVQANVVITVVAPTAPSTFTNTASVASDSPDRQLSNNSVGVAVQVK